MFLFKRSQILNQPIQYEIYITVCCYLNIASEKIIFLYSEFTLQYAAI